MVPRASRTPSFTRQIAQHDFQSLSKIHAQELCVVIVKAPHAAVISATMCTSSGPSIRLSTVHTRSRVIKPNWTWVRA